MADDETECPHGFIAHSECADCEVVCLTAKVAALTADAQWRDMFNEAAEHLPAGVEIRVCVEKGAGWVELFAKNGLQRFDVDSDNRLAAEMRAAIDTARSVERPIDEIRERGVVE